jgi:hypothetical protein
LVTIANYLFFMNCLFCARDLPAETCSSPRLDQRTVAHGSLGNQISWVAFRPSQVLDDWCHAHLSCLSAATRNLVGRCRSWVTFTRLV